MTDLIELLPAEFNEEIFSLSDEQEHQISEQLVNYSGSEVDQHLLMHASRYLKDRRVEDLHNAIRFAHKPTKLQAACFSLLKKSFCRENADSLSNFSARFSSCRVMVLHMSCWERLDLAHYSVKTFDEKNGVMNLVLVGRNNANSLEADYSYDDETRILSVPEADDYESLTRKMTAFFYFLGMADLKCCVLKADDDVQCNPRHFDSELICALANNHQYVGRVNRSGDGIYRWWHIGKCRSCEPYSAWVDDWVNGGTGYLLGRKACMILCKSAIYHKVELNLLSPNEDVIVAKALRYYGILPYHFDLVSSGLLALDGAEVVT